MMFRTRVLAPATLLATLTFAASSGAAATGTPTSAPLAAPQPAPRESGEPADAHHEDTLRIGPMVGIGFPRPFAVEALATIKGFVGAGLEYSFLPRMTIAGVDTEFKALAADLRVFPFHGMFFLGLRGGRQWLDASTTLVVGPVSAPESMTASTWFLNPSIGFLYRFQEGLTIGVDAGIQIPLAPEFQRSGLGAGTAATASLDSTLKSVAGALGNSVTPTVDVLRLGFLW